MTCLREGVVRLRDGRCLGYGEYGVRGGVPLLFFHGMPGGRAFDLGRAVADTGTWLFVLERPGIGLSDALPGATVLDWAADVVEFADAFGLQRFAVAGVSAGAPYAMSCGYALAERVAAVGLISAWVTFVGEPELDGLLTDDYRADLDAYRADPHQHLAERCARARERGEAWARDPDEFYREFFGPASDTLPAYWIRMLAATYGGPPSTPEDFVIDYLPWGFPVSDVSVPVHAWHGGADDIAPLAAVEELARRLPDAVTKVFAGEGHILDPGHRVEWLTALTRWG